MNKSILVTDKVHSLLINELKTDGFDIDYEPNLPLNETHGVIQKYSGVIVNSKTICDKSLINKAQRLKFIGRLGSGLEIIDLDYANKKGIHVLRTPEANCQSVAEHALGMILSLFNNLQNAACQLKTLQWNREENRGLEIRGKTIGIIGFGHTGTAFSNLLKSTGAHILSYDKYKAPHNEEILMSRIHHQADIISLHLPLTEETFHYVDKDFFSKCEAPFYLINTGRGKNIKTEDLIWALDNGKVLGACLDVFENEKPNTYSSHESNMYKDLMNRNNVICSPHVAGWTHESLERIALTMLNKIRALHLI